jgi:hypothetical protein
VSLAVVIGWSLGVGWVLTQLTDFTLFEGTLVGLLASFMAALIWRNILRAIPGFGYDEDNGEFEPEEEEDEFAEIPATKFYKNEEDKTWEAWFRYEIANSIFLEFQESPQPVAPMGEKQLQELAIRLADIAVSIFKRKKSRPKTITQTALKQEMAQMGQRPYDDTILMLAVDAINEELNYNEEIGEVIAAKLWDKPTDMFDFL